MVSYLPNVVQHILQTVELVVVKHTDGVDGYLLRGNPAVGDVGFAHRAAAVRMDGTEVGVHRFCLFLGWVRCCPSVLDVVNHLADRISQYRIVLRDNWCDCYFRSLVIVYFSLILLTLLRVYRQKGK